MTREEAIARVKHQRDWANEVNRTLDVEAFEMAAKALEDVEALNAINLDLVSENEELEEKLKQESFMNKPCISSKVCEHDKEVALDKIRTEIEEQVLESLSDGGDDWFTAEKVNECLDIIDKYRTESEG